MEPTKRPDQGRQRRSVEDQLAGRSLPHSIEAEQSVLGALLIEQETAFSVFQILSGSDFYSPRHAKLFEVMRATYERDAALDQVIIGNEMERQGLSEALGGIDFLTELVERVPTVANAEYYARIIQEKGILRALIEKCNDIVQGVLESDRSAKDQLDTAEQKILEIGRQGVGRDFVEIGQVIEEHFQRLDSEQGGPEGIMSGFTDLDSKTTGFHASEFIIVAGRPSMGKTSFSMNMVEHVALAGKTVAVFSLEVSTDQLIQNMLCSFSRVDAHRLRRRSLSHSDWNSLVDGASELSRAKIFIDDTPGLTPLGLKAKARRLHSRHPLDFIVIDYLQLMEGGGRTESRQQEISMVSRNLKGLARELEVPVVAISQLSRGVESREDHRPRLSDLRESGAIEQDADLVLLVYREEYYKPEKEEAKGKAEILIAKQRHGPTGKVALAFIGSYMRFENLAHYEQDPFAS